jgi:O-methyltransferase involved in polyketide biosynthesis
MSDSDKIAPTAHYTAYAWHVLGYPHAELFATELGRKLFRAYKVLELPSALRGKTPVLLRTLRNRHALIERELEALQPDLVVEIGAGLSRRGLTFALDRGTRYLEIDLPAMVAYKSRLIDERAPHDVKHKLHERFRVLAADVMADDFAQLLARELQGAERPVVIAEGLVGYFERALQKKLLRAVHGALAGRGAMLVDLRVKKVSNDRATRFLRFGILVATRGRGAADSFRSEAEVEGLFHDAGFAEVEKLPSLEPDLLSSVWRARP